MGFVDVTLTLELAEIVSGQHIFFYKSQMPKSAFSVFLLHAQLET